MIPPVEIRPRANGATPKVIRVPQGSRKQLVFRLLTTDGEPLDVTKEPHHPATTPPTFGVEKRASESTSYVRLIAREGAHITPIVDLRGRPLDECGLVEFLLPTECTQLPGMFTAEIGWFVIPDILVESWPCYMVVEPSAFSEQNSQRSGALTISEVRMDLFDHEITDASLLDNFEFSDLEITNAARSVVDQWNEMPPHLSGHTYTPATFPWRGAWISATVGILLRSAALRYLRNDLPHQAGGIVIRDQAKYDQYQARGDQLVREFDAWAKRKKLELNYSRAWGSSGIRY